MPFLFLPILIAGTIIFLSTVIRQITGFGFALLAMPLLTLYFGVKNATAVVGLIATIMGAIVTVTNWRTIDRSAAWALILSSLAGIPFGLLLLNTVPDLWVKMGLGVVLIGYGIYGLLRPQLPEVGAGKLTFALGFVAGMLGGAYNTSGPPVVIYGTLRRWSPQHFRATIQFYFFVTGLFTLTGQALSGLWTAQVFQLVAWSIPAMVIGLVVGHRINLRISPHLFQRIIFVFLILTGLLFFV